MKNKIIKVGVIGLIVALLVPFLELPVVNAAEDEDCTRHLQTYLFLDYDSGEEAYKTGYTTFTNFPFVFDSVDGNKVTVESIEAANYNLLSEKDEVDSFWEQYNDIVGLDSYKRYSKCNVKTGKNTAGKDCSSQINGAILVNGSKMSDYDTTTVLMHGVWARYTQSNKLMPNDWSKVDETEAYGLSYQSALSSEDRNEMEVEVTGATYYNNDFSGPYSNLSANYLNELINDLDEALDEHTLWKYNDEIEIPLAITRTLPSEVFENAYYYYERSNGDQYYLSTTSGSVTNSHEAYEILQATTDLASNYLESKTTINNVGTDKGQTIYLVKESVDEPSTKLAVKFVKDDKKDTGSFRYVYYWPFALNVEYTVCPTAASANEQWTLQFDKNTNDTTVRNVPSRMINNVGTDAVISSTAPTRNGYTFKGWCSDEDGSEPCYQPGDTYPSPNSATTKTLYASWGKTGSEDNAKTGVISYVIGFASVGIIAGILYVVIKKKNLFKQI